MLHPTFPTGGDHVADLTVMSMIHLADLGDGVFVAELCCEDPTGQVSHMSVGFHWSLGMSEIDLGQVMINGDAQHGAAFSALYADRLNPALTAMISGIQTRDASPDRFHRSSARSDGTSITHHQGRLL